MCRGKCKPFCRRRLSAVVWLFHPLPQCCQKIFLGNHDFWAKKSRKSRAKKLKIAEKSREKLSFSPKIWPPRAFLLHFYVTIFKKNQNYQLFFQKINFAKNNIAFCLKNFGPTFRVKNTWKNYGFLDKNDQFLGQIREFSQIFGKFSKIADF